MYGTEPVSNKIKVLVRVGASPASRDEAIRQAGQMLLSAGCIDADYIDSMRRRENAHDTYLDDGVSAPHGLREDDSLVRRDGIAVIQTPTGLEWDSGQNVRLVVGIAAGHENHLKILSRLSEVMRDAALLNSLFETADPVVIAHALDPNRPLDADAGTVVEENEAESEIRTLHTAWDTAGTPPRQGEVTALAVATDAFAGALVAQTVEEQTEGRGVEALDATEHASEAEDFYQDASDDDAGVNEAAAEPHAEPEIPEPPTYQTDGEAGAVAAPQGAWRPEGSLRAIRGEAVSPGLAVGGLYVWERGPIIVEDAQVPLSIGASLLEEALDFARAALLGLIRKAEEAEGPDCHDHNCTDAEFLRQQAALLDDKELIAQTSRNMVAGHGVAWSWHDAVAGRAERLKNGEEGDSGITAEGLERIGRRVLFRLEPGLASEYAPFPVDGGPYILAAEDFDDLDFERLDPARVCGVVSAGPVGAAVSALLRGLGLPVIARLEGGIAGLRKASSAVIDGAAGLLWLEPSARDAERVGESNAERLALLEAEREKLRRPAETMDGSVIEVSVSIGGTDGAGEISSALKNGSDGIGLLRTEFMFEGRSEPPGEDEQYAAYSALLAEAGGRPCTIRALDAGALLAPSCLYLSSENDSSMRLCGSRLLLRRGDIFAAQVGAIYRAAAGHDNVRLLFPMIASQEEAQTLRERCEDIRKTLDAPELPLGVAVEAPSAALMATFIAPYVDFFCIGTDELARLALASDQEYGGTAALHPAVLRLVRLTVKGAEKLGRRVGAYGTVCSHLFGASVLVGLGVNGLVTGPDDVQAVKAALRGHTRERLSVIARRCLDLANADAVLEMEAELEGESDANDD